jgi:hypothetical protein
VVGVACDDVIIAISSPSRFARTASSLYVFLFSLTHESGASSEYHFIKVTIDVLPYWFFIECAWSTTNEQARWWQVSLSFNECEFNHVLDTQQIMYCLRMKISRLLC